MKYVENIQSIAALEPDYMGFIFYERSERNFEGTIPTLPKGIKKTGVFVDEHLKTVISLVKEYKLETVQLHGDESVTYIQELKRHLPEIETIKAFGIKDTIDFSILKPYLKEVDYFLFDTKGKRRGGNGIKFDWSVLKDYPLTKPFFLSGGIGSNDIHEIKKIQHSELPIYAVDINSKFETKPGLKKFKKVKKFKNNLAV